MPNLNKFWNYIDDLAEFSSPVKRFSGQGLKPDKASVLDTVLGKAPKVKTPEGMEYNQGLAKDIKRGVKTSIGNTAYTLKSMREKGTIPTILDQINADLYKELPKTDVYKKGGKYFTKSRNKHFSDRPVKAMTDRDTAIVRKRKILTPLSVGMGASGASLAGLSYIAQPEEKSKTRRAGRAAAEGALFGLNPAVGTAAFVAPMFMDNHPSKKQILRQPKELSQPKQDVITPAVNVRVQ